MHQYFRLLFCTNITLYGLITYNYSHCMISLPSSHFHQLMVNCTDWEGFPQVCLRAAYLSYTVDKRKLVGLTYNIKWKYLGIGLTLNINISFIQYPLSFHYCTKNYIFVNNSKPNYSKLMMRNNKWKGRRILYQIYHQSVNFHIRYS